MHGDIALGIGGAVVGLLVGLTGMGGGALMTPMLVLLFGVTPATAISSDLVAALFMKPAGVILHWRRGTVQWPVVKYLCYGSVPSAFFGTYVMHLLGGSNGAQLLLQRILGSALILGALAMIARSLLHTKVSTTAPRTVRPLATVLIGVIGGFMVGLTSVGAGSLVLVLLMWIYPRLRSQQLVGTDLSQSIPLTMAATAGTFLFGHVAWAVTLPIIVGSVPAVLLGSWLSSKELSRQLRPFLFTVVLLSGLKYVGLSVRLLGDAVIIGIIVAVGLALRAHRETSRHQAIDLIEAFDQRVPLLD
jgi:uncharacterized membrane protein YfcA